MVQQPPQLSSDSAAETADKNGEEDKTETVKKEEPKRVKTRSRKKKQNSKPNMSEIKLLPMGLKSLLALVTLGICLGMGVVAAQKYPAPQLKVSVPVADVPARPVNMYCPAGPHSLASGDGENLNGSKNITNVGVVSGTFEEQTFTDPNGKTVAKTGTQNGLQTGQTPGIFAKFSRQNGSPLVAGVVAAQLENGSLAGLSAASCALAQNESWLLAGNTNVGNSAELRLANPATVPSEVTLRVLAKTGELRVRRANITVAPQTVERVIVDSLAPSEDVLAIGVNASGPGVVAVMQTVSANGTAATGTDLVNAGAPPALVQTVGGVDLAASNGAIRIANPGKEPLTAKVENLTVTGAEPVMGATKVIVEGGAVTELNLNNVGSKLGALRVSADKPVLAGAFSQWEGKASLSDPARKNADIAWSSAQRPGTSGAGVNLPDGTLAIIANPGTQTAIVKIAGRDIKVLGGGSESFIVPNRNWTWTANEPVTLTAVIKHQSGQGVLFSTVNLAADEGRPQTNKIAVIN